MRDLGPVGVDARRRRTLRRRLYYGKIPTGYGILIIMINLSPLGLRSLDVLMDTVDVYFG